MGEPHPGSQGGRVDDHLIVDVEGFEDSHDIFFTAVRATRMPMIVTDPRQQDNPIVFANEAFLTMTGYPRADVIGHNCRFLQGKDTSAESVAMLRDAIEAGRAVSTELLNYRKDGSSFWNALYIAPVHNAAGEVIYFFASQLDVSRRRDAEDALRQAQKMEALGQLTGGIAHDFNNLLQVVVGHLDVIQRIGQGSDTEPRRKQSLESIGRAVRKAATLTQQLLAFARKQSLQGRVVNLNALTRAMTDLLARTLGEQIQLDLQLAPDLWNCRIDPTQAEVALLNVLLNARDAMPGGGTVTIESHNAEFSVDDVDAVVKVRPGRYVCLVVSDNGVGMAPEVLQRVMEPFFTTKDEGSGTGLGLSMVYGFAKQSGGSVNIYSEPGLGTSVRLYFPAADGPALPVAAPPALAERGSQERVLVVDDREEVAELAVTMLRGLGYVAEVSASARHGLDRIERGEHFDLLLTDLIMPGGMNGVMLARQAQRLQPSLKVLLSTGYAVASIARTDVDGLEFDVLQKPYGEAELARKVRLALRGQPQPPKR